MREKGLEPVPDTSALFVSDRGFASAPNFGITVMLEGTRPILVEVQALCTRMDFVRPPDCAPPDNPRPSAALQASLRLRAHPAGDERARADLLGPLAQLWASRSPAGRHADICHVRCWALLGSAAHLTWLA